MRVTHCHEAISRLSANKRRFDGRMRMTRRRCQYQITRRYAISRPNTGGWRLLAFVAAISMRLTRHMDSRISATAAHGKVCNTYNGFLYAPDDRQIGISIRLIDRRSAIQKFQAGLCRALSLARRARHRRLACEWERENAA